MSKSSLRKTSVTGMVSDQVKSSLVTSSYIISTFEGTRLFLYGIAVLILCLIFWASVAPIDRVVRVEGTIIPAKRNQQIQHLEGGIVSSINTVEGATVRRGDLLLTIDDTTANADMSEVRDKLNAARARVIRLQAETKNQNSLVFPADLSALPVASAERSLFTAREQKLNEEISVHQDTIKQRTDDIEEAKQRRDRLIAESTTAEQRLAMEQAMAAQGAASKMEVLDAQSRAQSLKTEIGTTEDSVPQLQAAIAEEQARIRTAKADFISDAHNDLIAALEDVDHYSQASTTTADRLKRTEIRAPVDGIVNHIAVNTVGRVVKPGETLLELTPNTDDVLIEARTVPRDRGYLRVGLDARIRVSAYDSSELGFLKGHVTEVGADSIRDLHDEPYYQVNILVRSLPPSYAGYVIVPGMTVTADIVTGRRSVLAYLLSPVSKFTYNMFKDPR